MKLITILFTSICILFELILILSTSIIFLPISFFVFWWQGKKLNSEIITFNLKPNLSTAVPIVFIHGSSSNWVTMLIGIIYFAYIQKRPVVSFNLDGWFSNQDTADIKSYCQIVKKKIDLYHRLHWNQKKILDIDIIGHSMGGLIALQYDLNNSLNLKSENQYKDQEENGVKVNVRSIYCIASPIRGSPVISKFYNSKLISMKISKRHEEMMFGSPFIKEIETSYINNICDNGNKDGKSNKIHYIGSNIDFLVPPPYYFPANYNTLNDYIYSSKIFGHYSLIISPFVWHKINSWMIKINGRFELK